VHVWGQNKGQKQHGVLVTNLTPSNCRTYFKPMWTTQCSNLHGHINPL